MPSRSPRSPSLVSAVVVLVALITALCGPSAWAHAHANAPFRATSAITTVTAPGTWLWPVDAPRPVTRGFDLRNPYAAGHRGIDIGAEPGARVSSPADGVVRFAGVVVDRSVLSIEHDDGTVSSFEPVDPSVAVGDRVERGQTVASVSTSIRHAPDGGLHLGARVEGRYVDPLLLLERPPAAILLPLGELSALALQHPVRKEPT